MVAGLSYSIGYVGLDAVLRSIRHNTTAACQVKIALVMNKAGAVVSASAESAQSAVRSKLSALMDRSLCPGFGMCADVQDGDDLDVWPITAMTVRRPRTPRLAFPPLTLGEPQYIIVEQHNADANGGCERMKAVQDYVAWILGSKDAASIARGLLWAEMPVKIAARALDILRNMTCVPRSAPIESIK